MLNHKFIIRLTVGLMLLLSISSSAFAGAPIACYATSAGPIVDMFERPHTASVVVNTLSVSETHPIIDARKLPSELEPEGAGVLWLLLEPLDGSARGWVMYPEVIIFGTQCDKFGL